MELKSGHIVTFNHDPEIQFTVGDVRITTADIYWFDRKENAVKMMAVPKAVLRLTNFQVLPKD